MADKETPADDQLELKKRARRRLVGAVALALAAVIVLPMVMDAEPRPAGQDIQVRIPSQDGADSVIPRRSAAAAVTASPASAPSAPATDSVAVTGEKSGAAPTQPAAPVAATSKPVAVPKPAEKSAEVEDKAAAKVTEKAADHPVDKDAAKKAEEARAAAALQGKSTAPAASQSGSAWIVQLGAYQNAGNVKLLVAKLKEMGMASYTEKLDSPQGPRTRVRAGPFPSREAAEKAQARIRKIGVDGSVAPKQ